jgi:outer membrane protein
MITFNTLIRASTLVLTSALATSMAYAQNEYTLKGDVGLAAYHTPAITRTADSANTVLPYVYADYGPFYARINTVGYKALPLGAGHLELATRITLEGYAAAQAGITDRASPMPVGIGTFQKTAYGAFFAYAFHDPQSGGGLLDFMYAAKLNVAGLSIYPQLGVERRNAKYVQHLYGVSVVESVASGLTPYAGQSDVAPNAGVTVSYPLSPYYSVTYQFRKKWFGTGVIDSPLVQGKSQSTSFLALNREFH